jgi:hypothetical protein
MLPIFSSGSGLSTVTSSSLDLQFSPPNSLNLLEGGEFGCLEERIAVILATLAAQTGIRFQTYAYVIKRRARTKHMKGKKTGQYDLQYQMDAIIYGPEELCEDVGEYLARCDMFLQDPHQCDRDVPYRNPHVLRLSQEATMTCSLPTETF